MLNTFKERCKTSKLKPFNLDNIIQNQLLPNHNYWHFTIHAASYQSTYTSYYRDKGQLEVRIHNLGWTVKVFLRLSFLLEDVT